MYFPPQIGDILAWSTLFRFAGTWMNYLNYLKTGCMMVQAPSLVGIVPCGCLAGLHLLVQKVFDDPAVRRTTKSIVKAGTFESRVRMWIRRELIEKIVKLAKTDRKIQRMAVLYVITYIFLLRLPSEALKLTAGQDSSPCEIFLDNDKLVIVLARRKNKANGSRLTRLCWCHSSKTTCPVHVVGVLINTLPHGTPLFPRVTQSKALLELRRVLGILDVDQAEIYRCHDIRRGHALDLQLAGSPLHEILAAGEWRSPAFLQYLDRHALERDTVHEAHGLEDAMDSDGDEEVVVAPESDSD
jgi:hypothetical protein